jgi:hypothetical protein
MVFIIDLAYWLTHGREQNDILAHDSYDYATNF